MGTYGMKSNAETGEDRSGLEFRGGPLSMESTKAVYLQNAGSLKKMFKNTERPILLFEDKSSILDESNIKSDL